MTLFDALLWIVTALVACCAAGVIGVWFLLRTRNMQNWIVPYVRSRKQRVDWRECDGPRDVFIAVCDHYEPECYGASRRIAAERVDRWVREYPELFERYRDSSGRCPQHTFFFPEDEYRPEYLDALAELCAQGFGDVDVHLHHDHDTAEALAEKLHRFRDALHNRHGLLRTDPVTGQVVYGFIHGNWALCNSRPDGRLCGVDQELSVLLETGCYADFTLPSAPSPAQTRTINSIYYAQDIPGRRCSHDHGYRAVANRTALADHLLMIQGPLLLDWEQRKFGVVPRIENGDIHEGRPATWRRLEQWMRANVHVGGRPEWLFVKLHTHGCKDGNIDTWLGPETQRFHEELARCAARIPGFRYHYVTAWEMARLVHAAEADGPLPDPSDVFSSSTLEYAAV
ncbi:MAG: hypothetical protein DWQ34_10790 [Planctomycetota bacterium]|nr:MAG: hypothetical protein DWQ34_10790 [Planctomycetota bacterium]REK20769.1 MAG: hypothetical protein DWQ41_24310 [Planctomycetota bacterium]